MKTLKSFMEKFSGTFTPPSKGEAEFEAKHKIKKVADRNGNKDDVFQATNVKKVDRNSFPHHGYEPGEDAKVYEEIEINSGRFQNVHGKMPRGKASWFFTAHNSGIDFTKHKHGVDHIMAPNMDYSEAKEYAKKWAKARGHEMIHVSEDKDDVKMFLETLDVNLGDTQFDLMYETFSELDEKNQLRFVEEASTREGIEKLLDFAMKMARGE